MCIATVCKLSDHGNTIVIHVTLADVDCLLRQFSFELTVVSSDVCCACSHVGV